MRWMTDDDKAFDTKREADNHEVLMELVHTFEPIQLDTTRMEFNAFDEWAAKNFEWLKGYVRVNT